ncbi:MAG: ATP-binding cassette domain-containing protein [Lachnospiraceae bacterium]|nr:ATP-binding cassette domain-containing protein [Lachnospiraceae bacterium]
MLSLKDIKLDLSEKENLINGVSFDVSPGKLTVITGPNGGGKTSIAKLIAGIYVPTSGSVILDGEDITGLSVTERAQKGIAYAFQSPVSFKGVTVRKLMSISAGGEMSEMKMCRILEKVGLCAREYMDRDMDSTLSGGEMKRIEIATVLARPAKYIVFDEPEAGIDLWSFSSLIDSFETLKKEEDRALLIISHQERILGIADDIVVIKDGVITQKGSRDEVLPTLGNSSIKAYCPKGKEMF